MTAEKSEVPYVTGVLLFLGLSITGLVASIPSSARPSESPPHTESRVQILDEDPIWSDPLARHVPASNDAQRTRSGTRVESPKQHVKHVLVLIDSADDPDSSEFRRRVRFALSVELLAQGWSRDPTAAPTDGAAYDDWRHGSNRLRVNRLRVSWLRESTLSSILSNRENVGFESGLPPVLSWIEHPDLHVLGPRTSDGMRILLDVLENSPVRVTTRVPGKKSSGPVRVYSVFATADGFVFGQNEDGEDEVVPRDRVASRFVGAGVQFVDFAHNDKDLCAELAREIEGRLPAYRRSFSHSVPLVVVLYEGESQYASGLRERLSEAIVGLGGCEENNVLSIPFVRGTRGELRSLQPSFREGSLEAPVLRWIEGELEGASLSATEGESQIDYLRRALESARQRSASEGRGVVLAVFANSIDDSASVLDVARGVFPYALCMTTDLDVRMLEPRLRSKFRNVVVASTPIELPVDEKASASWRMLPMRDPYQVYVMRAMRAIVTGSEVTDGNEIGLYEIGTSRAIRLSIGPMGVTDARRMGDWAWTGMAAVMCFAAAAAMGIVAFGKGQFSASAAKRVQDEAVLGSVRYRFGEGYPLLEQSGRVRAFALGACVALALLGGSFGSSLIRPDGESPEPWLLWDGVSVWPSTLLRMIAIGVAFGLWRRAAHVIDGIRFEAVERLRGSASAMQCPELIPRDPPKLIPEGPGSIRRLYAYLHVCAMGGHLGRVVRRLLARCVSCDIEYAVRARYGEGPVPAEACIHVAVHRLEWWRMVPRAGLLATVYMMLLSGTFMVFLEVPMEPVRGKVALWVADASMFMVAWVIFFLLQYILDVVLVVRSLCRCIGVNMLRSWKGSVERHLLSIDEAFWCCFSLAKAIHSFAWLSSLPCGLALVARAWYFDRYVWPLGAIGYFVMIGVALLWCLATLRASIRTLRSLAECEVEHAIGVCEARKGSVSGHVAHLQRALDHLRNIRSSVLWTWDVQFLPRSFIVIVVSVLIALFAGV